MFNLVWTWILILVKRQLKNVTFLIMLLAIPLICILVNAFNNKPDGKPVVAYICPKANDEVSKAICESLTSINSDYKFLICDDEEELKRNVRNSNVECGYIFSQNILENMQNGIREGNITIVERMGNVKTDILNEVVFSEYYRQYGKIYSQAFMDHLANEKPDSDNVNNGLDSQHKEFIEKYDELMASVSENYVIEKLKTEKEERTINTARNLLGLLLFLYALLLEGRFIRDKERRLLSAIPVKKQLLFRFVYFTSAIFIIVPFIYLAVVFGTDNAGLLNELICIMFYGILLVILVVLLSYIIKNSVIIYGIIPVLTLAYIVICPVFIDLSNYFGVIKVIRYLCPPYYYMI